MAFELRVINTMDAGYATHFLGHVEAVHPGAEHEILDAGLAPGPHAEGVGAGMAGELR